MVCWVKNAFNAINYVHSENLCMINAIEYAKYVYAKIYSWSKLLAITVKINLEIFKGLINRKNNWSVVCKTAAICCQR